MSMYNLVHGAHPTQVFALALIDKSSDDFPRYRDAMIADDWKSCLILTRTGGGNRAEYKKLIDELKTWPSYVCDDDCQFDATYAIFKFDIAQDRLADAKFVQNKNIMSLCKATKERIQSNHSDELKSKGWTVDEFLQKVETSWKESKEPVPTSSYISWTGHGDAPDETEREVQVEIEESEADGDQTEVL